MKKISLTIVLFASAFLLFDSQANAQNVTSLNCPPTATIPGQEEALRSITRKYLTALQAEDWNTTSKLSVTFLTGFNLTQALMQDLLERLKIENSSFEIHEASVKPCEASVSYTLSLKAVDPQTHKRVIDVTGLPRMTHWRRFECECPPKNVTQWMLDRDVADVGDLVNALAAAKTAQEQRLLLLAKDDDKLNESAVVLARRGYELLEQDQDAQASNMFSLNRAVLGQVKHHSRVRNLQQASSLDRMLAEAQKKNDKSAQGSILSSLGQTYLNLGERERALKFFEDSFKFSEAGREVAASSYNYIAVTYRNRGEYARAVDYFLKSLELYKLLAAGNREAAESVVTGLTYALFNLSFLYEALGREGLAQDAYDELLLRIGKEGGDGAALFPMLLGLVKAVKGDVAGAVEQMERASSMFGRSVSEEKAWFVFISSFFLVEPYLRRNDYPQAAKHLLLARDALKGMEEEGRIHEHDILLLESMLYGSEGDEQMAASRTRQLFGNLTSPFLGRSGAGSNLREEGSNIAILPNVMALQAVGSILGSILGDSGNRNEVFNVSVVLNTAAFEHLLRGGPEDLSAARKLFTRVLEVAEADGDNLLIAQTHERIAGVYRREKNQRRALEHYQKSLQVIEGARLPLTLRLTEFEPTIIGVWRNIARIHAAAGDYEQALASYRKILDRSGRFYRLLDTTLLYEVAEINFKLGRYEDTLSSINQALSAAASGGDWDVLWKLHTLAGRSQRALKRNEAAGRSFTEAIREIEASRSGVVGGSRIQQRFFEDKLGPYHEMIAMLVEKGQCGEALTYAERSKSRVLLDALNHGNVGVSRPLTPTEREQERGLRSQMMVADREFAAAQVEPANSALVSQLREKRLEARLEYEAFRIGLQLPRTASDTPLKPQMGVIDLPETIALLPPAGGALLEFVVTSDKTYLFVITEGSDRVGPRGASTLTAECAVHSIAISVTKLNERAAMLNGRIANSQGVVQPLARELYDLLLKPAQAELTGRTTLVIVPDKYLWTLPFQALQSNDGRYVLQESAIYYAPSLTTLAEMRKMQTGSTARPRRVPGVSTGTPARPSIENPTLLVMANPAGDLSPLLVTESEAPRIAQLYGIGRTKVYVGVDANEGRFKKEARSFDVIHLGAHGLFDDDDPMYSRVLLSREEKRVARAISAPSTSAAEAEEDGALEAWEIMDLELKANLVVLSACETARGRVGDGEGIVGLTWALFMAGVPATVVSQWKVDEDATTELMYLFHENLVRSGRDDLTRPRKAEALRQASLKLIGSGKFSHPYYWAGFVLIGNGN